MNPKIYLTLRDQLADIYAFATMYNYLKENGFNEKVNIIYNTLYEMKRFKELVGSVDDLEFLSEENFSANHLNDKADIILNGHSDLCCFPQSNYLFIDLSILKNCAKPLTEEERKELRKKRGLSLEDKILVLGCPSGTPLDVNTEILSIAKKLKRHIDIYLVGYNVNDFNSTYNRITGRFKRFVGEFGVLRDYYAMADVSLINRNLSVDNKTLHNFIEATEGGPLFLVPPKEKYLKQFGYTELVDKKVIQEAENTEDLISKIKCYLKNPQGALIREQRRLHLEKCRNMYLKDLHRLINKALRISDKPFESDLECQLHRVPELENSRFGALTVIHPKTIWTEDDEKTARIPLKELNGKKIDKRCFRRLEEVK